MADIVLRGSFDVSQQRRYVHVPFEVPPGVGALHISYDYSDRIPSDPQLHGGNSLDIGLFDAPSSSGFRGWSGSHKLAFLDLANLFDLETADAFTRCYKTAIGARVDEPALLGPPRGNGRAAVYRELGARLSRSGSYRSERRTCAGAR